MSERVDRLSDTDLVLTAIQGYLGTALDKDESHNLLQAIAELLLQGRAMARPKQIQLLKTYAAIILP